MQAAPTKLLESYELTVSPIELADVPKLHELSVSVGWPHRAEDWALVIALGRGIVARDEIGRVVGSAMWFPLGDDHAAIGMVITSPRLQQHGAGRWLMGHIFDQVGSRGMVLTATRAAYHLYISLGFTPLSQSYQHQGVVTGLSTGPRHSRTMRAEDLTAVHTLDRAAMGISRPDVLERLLAISSGSVVERDGQVTGFALCRKYGRGHVVGPLVAENDEDAIALVAPFAQAMEGQFLRLDTRQPDGPFREFLVACGIRHYDTVMRMGLGAVPVATGPAQTYSLVNQALG